MKKSVEGLVERYKAGELSLFSTILECYQQTCRNWFRHVSRKVRIDKEDFARDFELLLFNALLAYDPQKREENRFDHYFAVALKMKTNDLLRQMLSPKNSINRKAVPLTNEVDIEDHRPSHSMRVMEISDSIYAHVTDPKERGLLLLKLDGYSIDEICSQLQITRREYWSVIAKIRSKVCLAVDVV
jgi:DNA-directed RNA polymerase specialized sigma24 family protein